MDDLNITMEEYIRLEEEKAQNRAKVFNWETAKYGKIWYDEDVHDLRSVETGFPAIAFNDQISSEKNTFLKIGLQERMRRIRLKPIRHMAPLPPREQRHPFFRYQGLEYTNTDIVDFEERLERIHDRDMHRVQVMDFQGMPQLMRDVLDARMLMEHRDDGGVVVFTSRAWRRLFDIRGPLVRELILEFLSTLRFGEVLLDLDSPDTIQFQLGGARRRMSWRQFILALGLHTAEEIELPGFARYWSKSERMIPGKGDLRDYWRSISTDGDFLGPPPSYTLIRDPVLRLCHRMMAHSIAGRSQAPKKVTVTDLFYLRGLDVGSVNIPYLLAHYLRRFAAGRKSGALISGPKRQPDAAAGAPGAAEGASVVDEGDQAVPTPVQAPPPPPAAARTMP
ncbi:hypothetical protein Tco_0438805 [Tanacetum coccineum]